MKPLGSLVRYAKSTFFSVGVLLAPTTLLAAPSPCPSDSSLVGYSNWYTLENDVQFGLQNMYIICPGSTFDLNDETVPGWDVSHWIYVQGADAPLTIQCGRDGARTNDCIVRGGTHHLNFGEGAQGVIIKGLTFQDARESSILVLCESGSCQVEALFEDCLWTGNDNEGNACNNIASTCAAGAVNSYKGDLAFHKCVFEDNYAALGAIFVREGSITIDQCKFEGNANTWRQLTFSGSASTSEATGSALTTLNTATTIRDSCFTSNVAAGPSTVKVNKWYLTTNENNYFDGNTVTQPIKGTVPACPALIEQGLSSETWQDNQCVEATGTNCDMENSTNECDNPNICNGRGTCSDHANGFTCTCDQPWGGPRCATDINNECEPDPCSGHGDCTDLLEGYRCDCHAGWGGLNCEEDEIDGCDGDPCGTHGNCIDQEDGYLCMCDEDWSGDNCNLFLDEESNFLVEWVGTGSPASAVVGTVGACNDPTPQITAHCHGGIISILEGGNHQCEIVDQDPQNIYCQSQQSGLVAVSCRGSLPDEVDVTVHAPATTTYCDGFANTGWGGSAIQALTLRTFCNGEWMYRNSNICSGTTGTTSGSPFCYTREICFRAAQFWCNTVVPSVQLESKGAAECNVDQCDPDPCLHGDCIADATTGYTCNCQEGWSGPNCDVLFASSNDDYNPCDTNPCSANGECIKTSSNNEGFLCACNDGWSGESCSVPNDSGAIHVAVSSASWWWWALLLFGPMIEAGSAGS